MTVGFGDGDGEREAEGGAGAEAAFDGNLAALRFDEAADEGEAETGAAAGGVAGEAAEDGGQALGLDAATGVVHEELNALLLLGSAEADVATFGRVAEGVGDEVVEDGAKRAAIGLDLGDVFEGEQLDVDVLFVGGVAAAHDGVAEGVNGADFLDAKLAAAGFELGDFDEVEHEVVEMFGFVGGAGGEFHLEGAQFAGVALGEGVEGEAQAADRLAQFLRGDGEEA